MSDLLVVKDKVQRALRQVFNIVNVSDTGFTVPYESTMCWVDFFEVTDPDSVKFRKEHDLPLITVHFWAMTVVGARKSNELFEWVATEGGGYNFGAFRAVKRDDDLYNVVFEYTTPGETIDPMEVKSALIAVCTTADDMDETLVGRFGGSTFANS